MHLSKKNLHFSQVQGLLRLSDSMNASTLDITFKIHDGLFIKKHMAETWVDSCPHADPFSRLYYIDGGKGVLDYDNRTYHLKEGTCYLFPAHRPIRHYSSPGLTHYYVHFTAHMPGGQSLFQATDWVCEKRMDDRSATCAAMLRIIEAPVTPTDILQRQSALLNMVQMFLGRFTQTQSEWHKRFQTVLEYINDHLDERVSLTRLAKLVALHPNYFSNMFKAVFGISPREHVMRKRIERAQMLLWQTDLRINEIGAAIGHDDPAYFCRFFKRRTGLTPLAYRQQRGHTS